MAQGGHRVSWMACAMPKATQLLIENKANGPAVAEELRADANFPLAIIEYNPVGSKDQRFFAASGDAEAGLIYCPDDAPWVGPLKGILCSFAGEGSIAHDDDCDAFSQLVNWSRQQQYGLLAYLDRQAAQAEAQRKPQRQCQVPDENGNMITLFLDDERQLWYDPKNPERTYPPGPSTETPPEGNHLHERRDVR
jgi:predicted phage terminase large subunit-like protein